MPRNTRPSDRMELARMLVGIVLLWYGVVGVYRTVSVLEFNSLWDHEPHALQSYTKSADARYTRAYHTALARAALRGWAVPELTVVQTTPLFDLWYLRWLKTGGMSVSLKTRTLIVDEKFMSLVADDDLECAMAHEVGHEVDAVHGREHDMTLWAFRCYDSQQFADAVGGILCGNDRYRAMFRRHIRFRYFEQGPCDPTCPVTP